MKFTAFALLFVSLLSYGQQPQMKPLEELINTEEPGWPVIQEMLKQAKNSVEVLPKDEAKAKQALYNTQVTTWSLMGSVIYETGGMLIDHGWIRLLGSGSEKLGRDIASWNKGKTMENYGEQPGFLLIADDVIGGFFALNGKALGPDFGKVYYFSPDTLKWEALGIGYSDFLWWLLSGDLQSFYEPYRWKGWEDEVAGMNGDQGLSFYPPLFAKYDSFDDLSKASVPLSELWGFQMAFKEQMAE